MLGASMTTSPARCALGQSLALDLHRCERDRLADLQVVKSVLISAAHESGATVVDSHFHQFAPHGVSGVVIITESHFAIHTWPEYRFAAIDVFTCSPSVNLQRAISLIKDGFRAQSTVITHSHARGVVTPRHPIEPLHVLLSVHPGRDCSPPAVRTFLDALNELSGSRGEPQVASQGFAMVTENLSVSGYMLAERIDVSVMCSVALAPPRIAEAALTAFKGDAFTFHTGF